MGCEPGTLSSTTCKHVRINSEVAYKEPEPVSWVSTGSYSSFDSDQSDLIQIGLHTKSPPLIQVMGKHSRYDPNRIPAFVFSSKPTTPMEWSVASNESLFSIHVGNNSFSKDLPILLAKSQELGKFDMVSNFSSNLSTVTEGPSALDGKEEPTEASVVVSDQTGEDEDQRKQNITPSVEGEDCKVVASSHSDGLDNECRRNNSEKVEVDLERQKSQPQTPKANPPNNAGCTWFSCFSFRSFCC